MAVRVKETQGTPGQGDPRDGFEAELQALRTAHGIVTPLRPATHLQKRRARAWVLRRALLVADVTALALALAVTQLFVVRSVQSRDLLIDCLMMVGLLGWIVLARLYGFYDADELRMARSTADDFPGLLLLTTLATWIGILTLHGTGLSHPRLHVSASFWILALTFVVTGRALARSLVQRRLMPREATIIIGAGRVGARIAEKLAQRPEYGLEVVGFIDDDPLEVPADAPAYLGRTERLEQVVRAHHVQRVIVAFSLMSADAHVGIFRRCMELGVQVDVVPRLYEVIGSRTEVHDLDGMPLISLKPPRLSRSARSMKRIMDLTVAGGALVVLSPLLAFCAWRIKSGSPGPVFFRQERMGGGGRRFEILKFRSMYIDAEERKREFGHLNKHTESGPRMFKIAGDPRITPFGAFMRKWSLDELPQLINVVRGEMSLVGPRPLILSEDLHIIGHGRHRLNLIPGVTGLWQVLGRSDIPFAEMVTLDYLYVTNWSLWGDFKLLARTAPAVMRGRGAY